MEEKRLRKIVKAKREQLTWQQVEAYSEKSPHNFCLAGISCSTNRNVFLSFGKS